MKTESAQNAKQTQLKKIFFDWTADLRFYRQGKLPKPPTEEEVWEILNSTKCPLNRVVVRPGTTAEGGNESNMQQLKDFAFTALRRFDHSCRGLSFKVKSPPGQGKTFLVKAFADTIGIPFVFVHSPAMTDAYWLFEKICAECEKFGTPIVEHNDPKAKYKLPPCIVFFDEAHGIPKKMQKGSLLNAMEMNDGYMTCNMPGIKGDSFVVNCREIGWIAATTEGTLFDAMASRLETTIDWQPASASELAKIISRRSEEDFQSKDIPFPVPESAALEIAKYVRMPRLACAFARKVAWRRDAANCSWEVAVEDVRQTSGIDEYGMKFKQIEILTALGQRSISKAGLANVAKVRVEELEREILPPLQDYSLSGGPLVVMMSGRGPTITRAGITELDRRGIAHKGDVVTAEAIEESRE